MVVESTLPGENGFHNRDGSLTKKKKKQWELEKGFNSFFYLTFFFLEEYKSWFPFGSPNNRSNFRHGNCSKPKTPTNDNKNSPSTSTISTQNEPKSTFSTADNGETALKTVSITPTLFPNSCTSTAFFMPGIPLINGVNI